MSKEPSKKNAAARYDAAMTHRFFLLFLFLLGYLILYPYTQKNAIGYYTFRVVAIAITVLSVYAVSFRRGLVIIALALAIPATIGRLHILHDDASVASLLNVSLTFVFDALIIVVIFRRVFVHGRPDPETVFGALCIYLMVGFSFAGMYGLMVTFQPHAFYLDPILNPRPAPNHFDLVYYSFATMTSLGAQGIEPMSEAARSLSVIEAILGLLYLAVLIARLMGAYRGRGTRELPESG